MYKVTNDCICCGVCGSITKSCQVDPTIGKAFCITQEDQQGLKTAMESCPVGAIIEEDN